MKWRYAAVSWVAAFLICMLISVSIVQNQTQALFETRRTALATTLTESRFEADSHNLWPWEFEGETAGATGTGWVLTSISMLGELGKVDAEKGLDFIFSEQNVSVGNTTLWGWPSYLENVTYVDLYSTYSVIECLRLFGALDRVNRMATIDVVASMYNESDGGFYQPTIRANLGNGEKDYASCGFPLDFHESDSSTAYGISNIISTFLAVSILADLNALDAINTTKTLNFVLSCKGENGVFKPFPGAQQELLPGWSISVNPFWVDSYGTGLAYTFAGTGALNALGVDITSFVNPEQITNYVFACQEPYPVETVRFSAFPNDIAGDPLFDYDYYAIRTLQFAGTSQMPTVEAAGFQTSSQPTQELQSASLSDNETAVFLKLGAFILNMQDLHYNDSWPLPTRGHGTYGLFSDMTVLANTYEAIYILNATNNLHILDQPTPIISPTWVNLQEISFLVSSSATAIVVLCSLAYKRLQERRLRGRNKRLTRALGSDVVS